MHARTSGSSGNVRDRLKRSVLSGRLVASGHGDELLRPFGGGPSFPRDLEEIVSPEIDLLRPNRLEPHVGVLPASLLVLHALIPPVRAACRTVLSVLWTIALVGFIIFVFTDLAALVAAPAYVVPGIQAIGSGNTVNSGFGFDAGNWTFDPLGTGSVGTYRSAGGNPGGFLEMSLPSSGAHGYWWQAFRVDGSVPFTGAVHLDVEISGGLTSGRLIVAVDGANSPPDPRVAIGLVNFTGPTSWTAMPRFLADDRLADPGLYYLKVAFFADSATSPVSVGFDNVRLGWTTDAAVVVYLPSPAPFVVFFTQDKTLFISYFAFLY